MAGVPNIMQAMLGEIIPTLRGGSTIQSLSVTTNVLEGTLADGLTAIQNRYPEMDIGSYPQFVDGRGITTLVMRSADASRNKAARDEVLVLIDACGGQVIEPPVKA